LNFVIVLLGGIFMKKRIVFFMVLSVCSGSVFALPASKTEALDNLVQSVTSESINDKTIDDDLFADIQATALADKEAQSIKGEGIFTSPWAAGVTFVAVTAYMGSKGYSPGITAFCATGAAFFVGCATWVTTP
jgi:N-acetylglucosamine kinase-like BadF-type ATPase